MVHLFFVILLFLPSQAWAGFAVVAELSTPDAGGRWKIVQDTPRAAVVRGDQRLPLHVGDALNPGDRVVTDEARVRIDLGDGEDLSIAEHSDVEVHERSTLQRLGDVFYRVRSRFTVDYGTVQTSVEGTEFSVRGADGTAVEVVVAEGRVRVKNGTEDVLIRRWQAVRMPQVGDAAVQFAPELARAAVDRSFLKGRPVLRLGALAGVGAANEGAAGQVRLFARLTLAGPLRLSFDTALGNNGGSTGLRLPQGLGLDLSFGGLAVGAQAVTTVEIDRLGCDGAYAALHIGGVGAVRYSLPLSRRFSLDGELRGGWVDGLVVDGAVGFGVAL